MENGEKVIGMLRHVIIGLRYRTPVSDSGIGAASALRLGLATMRRNIQR